MSEARVDVVLQELRDTAPLAPEALRERVRELREPAPTRRPSSRPALVAIPVIVRGLAVIGGLSNSSERTTNVRDSQVIFAPAGQIRGATTESDELRSLAPSLTSKRLQQQ